jgi:hypothetical protein
VGYAQYKMSIDIYVPSLIMWVAPGFILSSLFSLDATKKCFNTDRRKKIHEQREIDIDKHCITKRSYTKVIFLFLIDCFLSVRHSIQ